MKLALQVALSDLHVAQGHADGFMPQQFHDCRKTNAEADHFRVTRSEQPDRCAA